VWNDGLIRFSEISKMRCSASSRKLSTSAGASYDELAMSVAIDPRLRSTALSCTISRVVRDVRSRRHNRRQLRDVCRPADLLEYAACAQRVGQRDRIDRLAVIGKLRHRAEDLPMRLAIKIFVRKNSSE